MGRFDSPGLIKNSFLLYLRFLKVSYGTLVPEGEVIFHILLGVVADKSRLILNSFPLLGFSLFKP